MNTNITDLILLAKLKLHYKLLYPTKFIFIEEKYPFYSIIYPIFFIFLRTQTTNGYLKESFHHSEHIV